MVYKKQLFVSAFTIVELLVVIVVIGVLAAITIVSYTGITNKAVLASLQSDLSNTSMKLKAYQAIYGSYPTLDTNNCPTAPTVDDNYCLKFSPGNTIAVTPFAGYIPNNSTTPQTFSLTLSSNGIQGVITESTKPSLLTPAPLNPVADWIATPQGDHYGNYYDTVTKTWANVTRSTPKTIYDPTTQHIYDVPANKLAINPRSDGKNGHEAVIEEARTNLFPNGHGAINANGRWGGMVLWNKLIGVPEFNLVRGVYGDMAQQIKYTGLNGETDRYFSWYKAYLASGVLVEGSNAVASLWVKLNMSSGVEVRFLLSAYDANNSTHLGTVTKIIPKSDKFIKIENPYASLPVGTAMIRITLQVVGLDVGKSLDMVFDSVQLEKGSFATSYIPTATATATRDADNVAVATDTWNPAAGTIVGTLGVLSPAQIQSSPYWLFCYLDSTTGLRGRSVGSNLREYGYVHNAVSYSSVSTYDTFRVTAFNWSVDDNVYVYSNGAKSTYVSSLVSSSSALPSTASIGSASGIANFFNTSISRIAIYPTALSDADVQLVTNTFKDGA